MVQGLWVRGGAPVGLPTWLASQLCPLLAGLAVREPGTGITHKALFPRGLGRGSALQPRVSDR